MIIPPQGYPVSKQSIDEYTGTLVSTSSEQNLINSSTFARFEGWIDLSEMASGDEIIVSEYVKMKENGGWKLYADAHYSGFQEHSALRISTHVGKYGVRVTLKQISGSFRSFDYIFWIVINFL